MEVFGADFDDDAGVAPSGVAGGGAHTVDDDLLGAGGCGDDKAARTHTKTINASATTLRCETVLGCGEPRAAPLAAVVHDTVDHLAGVLEAYADGKPFGFELDALLTEHTIDVACAMAGGKDDGAEDFVALGGDDAADAVAREDESVHTGIEAHLASAAEDGVAHILDDSRQSVGAYMGMGGGEDIGAGSVLAEDGEDAAHITPLGGAGVELAVGVGSCPTLTEGVVALGVDDALTGDEGDVFLALMDIFASLEDDGAQPVLYESQCCEESCGACSYDDDLRLTLDIGIGDLGVGQCGCGLIDIDGESEVDHHLALACIDAAARDAHALYAARGDGQLIGHSLPEQRLGGCHLGDDTEI